MFAVGVAVGVAVRRVPCAGRNACVAVCVAVGVAMRRVACASRNGLQIYI